MVFHMRSIMPGARTLFFLLCTVLTSTARPQVTVDSLPGRWSLGLTVRAGMGHRTLSSTTSNATNDAIIKSRDDREQPSLAIGAYAGVGYRLSKHWGLEVGVGYQQLGWQYAVDFSDLTFGDMIDPRRGFIYPTDNAIPSRATLTYSFEYLEFPLGITFETGKRKWRTIAALGVAPALLVAAKVRTKSEYAAGGSELNVRNVTDQYGSINLIPYLRSGIAFQLCERWQLSLVPTIRYGALQIINTPITAHLFMGTIDVGVRFLP